MEAMHPFEDDGEPETIRASICTLPRPHAHIYIGERLSFILHENELEEFSNILEQIRSAFMLQKRREHGDERWN